MCVCDFKIFIDYLNRFSNYPSRGGDQITFGHEHWLVPVIRVLGGRHKG